MGARHRAKGVRYCDVYSTTVLPMYSSKPEERRKDICHPSAPAVLGRTCHVVFCSTMQMWPFDAHQMTDDHVWSWDNKAAMKHMDIIPSDFCQMSQGGSGCLDFWGLDQTNVPLLQGEPCPLLQKDLTPVGAIPCWLLH